MSWLDISIIGILGLSVIYSFVRGMVRELFSFLALIAAYMVATRVYGYGAPYLDWAVSDRRLAGGISFAAVFLTVGLLVGAVGRLLHAATRKARLSFANRLLGAAFGLIKGVVLVSVLLLFVPVFSKAASQGQLLQGSVLASLFDVATEAISAAFPTRKYGALDNRLSRELRAVRDSRGKGFWADVSRLFQRGRAGGGGGGPSDSEPAEKRKGGTQRSPTR